MEASTILTSTSAFAFSMLVRMQDSAANRTLLSIDDGPNTYCLLWMFTSAQLRFDVSDVAAASRATSNDFTVDRLHHVHCQYTGSATEIYVDGVKGTDAGTPTAPVFASQLLRLWLWYNDTLPGVGDMRAIDMWDGQSLTQAEILDNMRYLKGKFGQHYA